MLLTNSKHSLSITGHWLGSNRWAVSCERQQWSDNKITCSLERRRISSKFESLVCLLISGVVSLWWFYMVSRIIHAFWSILNYDRLENRCMEMSPLTCLLFFYLLYKTSGLHVSVRLYSYRSQKTSKFDKNISDTLGCASWATYLYLTSSVSYSSTDARKHGIYLLSKYTLETFADLMNIIQSMLGMFIPVYKTLRYAKCVGKKTHKVKQKDWKYINSISILLFVPNFIGNIPSHFMQKKSGLAPGVWAFGVVLSMPYIYIYIFFFFPEACLVRNSPSTSTWIWHAMSEHA